MPIHFKVIAIVAIEAVLGGKPQKAIVLGSGIARALRKTIFLVNIFKMVCFLRVIRALREAS